ncbi:MAG: hypothetical protein IT293_10780 [Deltaproteobacteria bacterium]|nr:hypothetical protein [Deltaproteobacteria bacterium]
MEMGAARWSAVAARCALAVAIGCGGGDAPTPIAQGFGARLVPAFTGRPAVARPVAVAPVAQHPFMARNGWSNMHGDGAASDTHPEGGPLGRDPEIVSTARGFFGGECASVTFDRAGRIVTVCTSARRMQLLVLDPATLRELAAYDMPPRPSMRSLSIRTITTDTSGGAYFYLDEQDRVVVGTAAHRIEVVAHDDAGFRLERAYDLAATIAPAGRASGASGGGDAIVTVLPDWSGRWYWFVTRLGMVGTVERESGRVATHQLDGERIQNSFAVGPEGAFIVSDHALYDFVAAPETGAPTVAWRALYDRGARRKLGQLDQGSGTTPTLLGDEWVAIADNAEPRLNVLVYRRGHAPEVDDRRRLICKQPLFAPGASATDNSFIGVGRSLVVENNAGYDIFPTMMFGRTGAGGVARVDVDEQGLGCHVVWTSPEISQTTVPKLSLGNGLVYLYTKLADAPWWTDAYYLTAVDFRTGETVYRARTGVGLGYDNHWAPVTIGPNGTAYVGTLRGLLAVRDR